MKTINALLTSLFSLNILDIITTYIGLTTKLNIAELNSIYYVIPFTINCFIKIALVVFLIILYRITYRYIKTNQKDAIITETILKITAIILVAIYLCVIINNLIILKIA
jgi:hypothetical protein